MNQNTYNKWDTALKLLGFFGLIVSAFFAYSQYVESKDRDFRKALFDRQVAVVGEVFTVLSEIEGSADIKQQKAAANRFWMIYHGSATAFFTPRLYRSLSELPADYVRTCVMGESSDVIKDCKGFTAAMAVSGFARTAREELAVTWAKDMLLYGKENPWFVPVPK